MEEVTNQYWYYIVENLIGSSDHKEMKGSTRILKIPDYIPGLSLKEGDGPYRSLRALKKYSSRFRNFSRTFGSKQVEKLLSEKNILNIKDYILTPGDYSLSKNFIKMYDHVISGKIKDSNVYGVHLFNPKTTRIIEITKPENSLGVWEAAIEVFDSERNRWVRKDKPTTFFPKGWTAAQLLQELEHALANKEKIDGTDFKFSSVTLSGVPVNMVIENEEVKTIYPILEY